MKKFKLIKTYPGSPNLGEILIGNKKNDRFHPTEKCMENNPEFWEEVKEFPKIISFRSVPSKNINTLTNKGTYNDWSLDSMLHVGECVDSGHFEIYQVAVSESEVFTLGDKVTYNYKANYAPWTIGNFFIRTDGKILARSKNNSICEIVSEIKKVPGALFVTEDGVEIFDEFQEIFGVNLKDYMAYSTEISSIRNKHLNKFFSTKKAAEKYIDENKPIYSKKQVKEALECAVHEYIKYVNSTSWERTFKQKLNL